MKKILLIVGILLVFMLTPEIVKAQYQIQDLYTGNIYNISGYDSIYFKLTGRTLAKLSKSYSYFDGRFISKNSGGYLLNDSLGLGITGISFIGVYKPIVGSPISATRKYWLNGYLDNIMGSMRMKYENTHTGYSNIKIINIDTTLIEIINEYTTDSAIYKRHDIYLMPLGFFTRLKGIAWLTGDTTGNWNLGFVGANQSYINSTPHSITISTSDDTNAVTTSATSYYWDNYVTNGAQSSHITQYPTKTIVDSYLEIVDTPLKTSDSILVIQNDSVGYKLESYIRPDTALYALNSGGGFDMETCYDSIQTSIWKTCSPLVIKSDNDIIGYVDNLQGNTSLGSQGITLISFPVGTNNTSIGASALLSNMTGSNNLALGSYAGAYSPNQSDRIWINSLKRNSEENDSLLSPYYANQSTTLADQKVRLNGQHTITGSMNIVGRQIDTPSDSAGSPYLINSATGITDTMITANNIIKIQGNGAIDTLLVQISTINIVEGTILEMWNCDSINYVTFHSDFNTRLILENGIEFKMKFGDMLRVRYMKIGGIGLWREVARKTFIW